MTIAPPCPASLSASAGRRSVPPVARRMRSRNSGLPTERQTSPSPSSSTMVLPRSPWAAGQQPVAMQADVTRVTEGNTPEQPVKSAEAWASAASAGAVAGEMRSRRRLSQTTRTARRMDRSLPFDAPFRADVECRRFQRTEEMPMEFEFSARTKMYQEQLVDFMSKHVYPSEQAFVDQLSAQPSRWQVPPIMEELKAKARERGLWNLFLPESELGAGLTNLEYAPLCEIMGRSPIAPEAFNCAAPDTGNMEVLTRYGTPEQKKQWLEPLLDGKIRSAFAMTEPKVASSDATNIESEIKRDGDSYVINGHKWWTSGIGDPRCKILIFMGKTDAKNPDRYKQQSMILVPRDSSGIKVVRMLTVFGYDDAPHGHGEVLFENVRVPASNMLLGEGRGFEIAQGRLGPGRIHHCMRQIGVAERALELMCKRAHERVAFGKRLSENDITLERIAQSRIEIDQARLLVLNAAWMMDTVGNKAARQAIAAIKVAIPNMTLRVLDRAMQLHGGGGVSQAFPLAFWWAHSRTLRFADGPDEVHRRQIGRLELRKYY